MVFTTNPIYFYLLQRYLAVVKETALPIAGEKLLRAWNLKS